MILMEVNVTYIMEHLLEYMFSAYDVFGVFKYPLLIVAIVGYVFLYTKSATLSILVILVAFSIFGATGMFAETFILNNLFAVLTIFGLVALFIAAIFKKEVGEVVTGE